MSSCEDDRWRSLCEFDRELLRDSEKVLTALIARVEVSQRQSRKEIKETRARTKALLAAVDRFDEHGGASSA
jgi:hypothetical protein